MKVSVERIAAILLLIFVFAVTTGLKVEAQDTNYAEIFGKNWIKAIDFEKNNEVWMQLQCNQYGLDYNLVISVVFPELVRYSAIRDKMELTILKALYTNKGREYSDFSVGVFQIKPSCAEAILDGISHYNIRKLKSHFTRLHRGLNEKALRAAIVRELENPQTQLLYLTGLIKILDKRFNQKTWIDNAEKIKFYAAAYNGGFSTSEEWITGQMTAKTFHTQILKPEVCYTYADVAAAFYNEKTKTVFSP